MKRYLIFGGIAGALLLVLVVAGLRGGGNRNDPRGVVTGTLSSQSNTDTRLRQGGRPETRPAEQIAAQREYERALAEHPAKMAEAVRLFNETRNLPVTLYGQVVDQDGKPLPGTQVNLAVQETYAASDIREISSKITQIEKRTGDDGRFEVSGLNGDSVTVEGLTNEGYEPELLQKHYGIYGPQSTSYDNPVIFKMWRTNFHEPLITGEKSFDLIPDGRHYAIDFAKGKAGEGDEGDLVVWIKRPASVKWGEKYDWSCQLMAPVGGGLVESQSIAMPMAPESGYTNLFALQEQADTSGSSGGFANKGFYVRLRNGKMYGRVVISLYADFHRTKAGLMEISYAVNPSGSRLLR